MALPRGARRGEAGARGTVAGPADHGHTSSDENGDGEGGAGGAPSAAASTRTSSVQYSVQVTSPMQLKAGEIWLKYDGEGSAAYYRELHVQREKLLAARGAAPVLAPPRQQLQQQAAAANPAPPTRL